MIDWVILMKSLELKARFDYKIECGLLQEPQDQAAIISQRSVPKKSHSKKAASKQENLLKKALSGGKSSVDKLLYGFNNRLENATPRIDLSRGELHTTFSIDAKGKGKISVASKI